MQGQTEPSWKDGADEWILSSTLVRFLGGVESERSFLVTRCARLLSHGAGK